MPYQRGTLVNRPNPRPVRHTQGGTAPTTVPGWLRFWSSHGFNNKKSAIASAVYTIVFSLIVIGFASYELYKLDQFWYRYHATQWKASGGKQTYTNKDHAPIADEELLYFISIAGTEKGLLAAFLCLALALILSSTGLIVGVTKEKKELTIPWILFLCVLTIYGTVLVIMDCIVYEFGAENNLELLIWVSFIFGAVHSLRCVVIYYRQLSGHLPQRRRTMSVTAEFDPRQANDHSIFTTSQSVEPVVIQMTPPPYEKDPPVYSIMPEDVSVSATTSTTNLSTAEDKPPDYTP